MTLHATNTGGRTHNFQPQRQKNALIDDDNDEGQQSAAVSENERTNRPPKNSDVLR